MRRTLPVVLAAAIAAVASASATPHIGLALGARRVEFPRGGAASDSGPQRPAVAKPAVTPTLHGDVSHPWDERPLTLPFVGRAMGYVPHATPRAVVLFVSGDGGWNLGVVDMARRLAASDVVIGVSLPTLRRHAQVNPDTCWYPAGDLELISHAAQKGLKLPDYHPPILVGYSSGATLVYAALAAAPPGTFAGALSLGFCRDLEVRRPVCPDEAWKPEYDEKKGVSWLPPQPTLGADWHVIHGVQDQVCSPEEVQRFAKAMGSRAHVTFVEKTGHGFGRPVQWAETFDAAIDALSRWAARTDRRAPPSVSMQQVERDLDRLGLPLEYTWPADPASFVVFLSGDGGWASLDQTVAERLASKGVGIVGVNSLKYFWRARAPEQVAADLEAIVTAIGARDRPVYVGGYSFGAEAGTVALARGDVRLRSAIAGLLLVAPGRSASFEIDPLDWIRTPREDAATRVAPAIDALGLPTLCVAGVDDKDSACRELRGSGHVSVVQLPGSHHFGGDYEAVARALDDFIHRERPRP